VKRKEDYHKDTKSTKDTKTNKNEFLIGLT
jgi:hypothetical protein